MKKIKDKKTHSNTFQDIDDIIDSPPFDAYKYNSSNESKPLQSHENIKLADRYLKLRMR